VLTIGFVRKSHGLRGFFHVQSCSGETAHFCALTEVSLRGADGQEKVFPVEECKSSGKNFLMKLRGIDSPEEAARYNGREIRVPRGQAAPLLPGQYYIDDLRGCSMITDGGKKVGTVRDVIDGAAYQMFELAATDGKMYFVPFVEAHVGKVDTEARTIELKSEWLLQ
jgi:16S rRNA processing protein RimM